MIEASIYETNRTERVRIPGSAVASTIFHVPALGDAAKESGDQLAGELEASLGEQRWPLVEWQLQSYGTHTLRRVLSLEADHEGQEVAVWISPIATAS